MGVMKSIDLARLSLIRAANACSNDYTYHEEQLQLAGVQLQQANRESRLTDDERFKLQILESWFKRMGGVL